MAATGVTVTDAAIADFNDFKKQSSPLQRIIFKIVNGTIVVEEKSESGDFDEFLENLPADDCRYAVYKCNFTTNDGRPGTKLASITW
jgi:cofilin